MIKNLPFLILGLGLFISNWSCRPRSEVIITDNALPLTFSKDTVQFDTLFSSVGSVNKRLTVFNPNKNAVRIEEISLGLGGNSPYNLFINGKDSYSVEGEVLNGGDSLKILVEITIDPKDQDLPFLVKDSINFRTENNQQDVKLISWGQDAHFYKEGEHIEENTQWTANRPYVIVDSLVVKSGKTLTIEKGSRIYFNYNAGLFIQGSLEVLGSLEEPVLFRNERLDQDYDTAGQWKGISFLGNSDQNIIDYAIIRNGDVGIYLYNLIESQQMGLTLSNTIIENMNSAGIYAINSDIYAYNTLINHCNLFTAAHFGGGNYRYEHCTLEGFGSRAEALLFYDVWELQEEDIVIENNLELNLVNNIIWGNFNSNELLIHRNDDNPENDNISNNLIRSNLEQFNKDGNLLNTLETNFPKFVNSEAYDYHLDNKSPAIGMGIPLTINDDLAGNSREESIDLGVYQFVEKEEE
ncbi:right-handed parallel beta-helix repeat-containing protein [Xanthovirga aplysinae]|uniref:right-handed parallel beta-helix repeat-containing protein n=1 Tax=Xanthovirga aplysinae TaxID=2529853 RepID=UPI0012BC2EC7|nr:right-handed parallel beta-helix repeat-containing protein [Xanthovirga aplysinae]MTI32551.1 hypothetical protein [Xanthovirga aplysinae]